MSGDRPRDTPEEEQGFDTLFRLYSPTVFRFALRHLQGRRGDAEDLVQSVFLAVWRQYPTDFATAPDSSSCEPLIMTIAGRRVIDYWRRDSSEDTTVPETVMLTLVDRLAAAGRSGSGVVDEVLGAAAIRAFWDAIATVLPANEYRVAVLSWEFDYSPETIGEILGISRNTVYEYRSRARRTIEQFRDRGGHIPIGSGRPRQPSMTEGGATA